MGQERSDSAERRGRPVRRLWSLSRGKMGTPPPLPLGADRQQHIQEQGVKDSGGESQRLEVAPGAFCQTGFVSERTGEIKEDFKVGASSFRVGPFLR